mmetsp:Transcript_12207/g.29084  ORF Transcript_12207/g.29084 Transcript_12207/m.29084 type:complete len:385 (-) Transcript_12207:255-1409(-)
MSTTNRMDSPALYEWTIDQDSSSRYEYPRGQVSDDELQIQFSIMAFVNGIVVCATSVLILGILRSRKIRSNAFSLFILFMAIPDFLGAFFCLLTCALSATRSKYFSEAMCGFQSFYLVFAICGNCWINFVIVHEVHKLLTYSQNRRRYFPPTRQQVFCKVAAVYAYASIWGLLAAFPIPGMPFQTKAYHGFACFPMEQDTASTWFFYFAFLPGILLCPFMYSLFVIGRIILKGMLPQSGKRRKLSIFLMRLIGVYFFGWTPFLTFAFMGNAVHLSSWVFWGGAAMSHLQGLISAVVVFCTSDDIRRQMILVLRCNFSDSSDPPREFSYGRTTDTRFSRDSSLDRAVDQDKSEPTKAQGSADEQEDEEDVESSIPENPRNCSVDP